MCVVCVRHICVERVVCVCFSVSTSFPDRRPRPHVAPQMGLPVALRLGDQQLKEGADGTDRTRTRSWGWGHKLRARMLCSLLPMGPEHPPRVLGSERRGHPGERERGPNPGTCVFRGGRGPGCQLLWEAGVNWDAERAKPV